MYLRLKKQLHNLNVATASLTYYTYVKSLIHNKKVCSRDLRSRPCTVITESLAKCIFYRVGSLFGINPQHSITARLQFHVVNFCPEGQGGVNLQHF